MRQQTKVGAIQHAPFRDCQMTDLVRVKQSWSNCTVHHLPLGIAFSLFFLWPMESLLISLDHHFIAQPIQRPHFKARHWTLINRSAVSSQQYETAPELIGIQTVNWSKKILQHKFLLPASRRSILCDAIATLMLILSPSIWLELTHFAQLLLCLTQPPTNPLIATTGAFILLLGGPHLIATACRIIAHQYRVFLDRYDHEIIRSEE